LIVDSCPLSVPNMANDNRQTTDTKNWRQSGKTDTSLVWSSEENCNTQRTIWETAIWYLSNAWFRTTYSSACDYLEHESFTDIPNSFATNSRSTLLLLSVATSLGTVEAKQPAGIIEVLNPASCCAG
jgi:hypothetical protein